MKNTIPHTHDQQTWKLRVLPPTAEGDIQLEVVTAEDGTKVCTISTENTRFDIIKWVALRNANIVTSAPLMLQLLQKLLLAMPLELADVQIKELMTATSELIINLEKVPDGCE